MTSIILVYSRNPQWDCQHWNQTPCGVTLLLFLAVLNFLAKLFSMRPRKRAWQCCDISIGSINLL